MGRPVTNPSAKEARLRYHARKLANAVLECSEASGDFTAGELYQAIGSTHAGKSWSDQVNAFSSLLCSSFLLFSLSFYLVFFSLLSSLLFSAQFLTDCSDGVGQGP
jgi:hypothetical protein